MKQVQSASDLETEVVSVVRGIAPGDVMTYGEVAEVAGYPGRARAVGRVLASTVEGIPWWRVVAAGMRIVAPSAAEQRRRLEDEGHRVEANRIIVTDRLD